jgi:2-oxoglutarate ferredoxin oxidoreductase subunit beta
MYTTVYAKSEGLVDIKLHYCPGCPHGIIHKLVAETLVELEALDGAVGVGSVGCSAFSYNYFNCDMIGAAHGRAPAVATGCKRANPENVVFTYQGDGDLASIGTGDIVHAAHRGEKITVIFVNNAIYGMTGGQMAPTTLVGQKTTTSPYGRDEAHCGAPYRVSEMLATIPGAAFVERVSALSVPGIRKAKKAIKKAFQTQIDGLGFSIVEILSTCPTNWGMTPQEAITWSKENLLPYYPLGCFRDPYQEGEKNA